jgi:hypothetical protein
MSILNLLILTITSGSPTLGKALPTLVGNSAYVSVQANKENHRSRIDVYGVNFIIRAVGTNSATGADSDEGGLITIKDNEQSISLQNIAIESPKKGVVEWSSGDLHCQRLVLSGDVYSSACTNGSKRFNSVVSKSRGVLTFTGFCRITDDQLCEYVLISKTGISPQ